MSFGALIFDCDGVLVDTERDGHLVAFNQAFVDLGIDAHWSEALYDRLLQTGGGKERMTAYFDEFGWPAAHKDKQGLIAQLHKRKSEIFLDLIDQGKLTLRPGIARIIDEAISAGLKLAVCSTSKLESVQGCLALAGPERVQRFDRVLAGDIVSRKKPDPEIYNLASTELGVPPDACIVVEDSGIGCRAAVAAGMRTVITMSAFTRKERFEGAFLVTDELGDGPDQIALAALMAR
ncbi:HAD-IA family hydrolase [Novosphingobium sp. B 225]|uniref:HAD-IA family hydrolase n=1 Tax=Novosphingobium sp. B 225 TaxID=1961849 RepID=UPI000B4B86AE|nr:HAD-IA family hydrolase [Novosphingobium sp. B 225]